MGRPVIVVGDATDHGGQVISGDMTANIEGKPIARVGDMVHCPKCNGTFPIVEGVMDTMFSTMPVAVHGHKTACGATLIGSQTLLLIYVDAGNSLKTGAAPLRVNAPSKASMKAESSNLITDEAKSDESFDQFFQLIDDNTGEVLANRKYRIHALNEIIEGRSNESGYTKRVTGKQADRIRIEIFAEDA